MPAIRLRCFFLLFFISVSYASRGQSSVLAQGEWYKIGVLQSGIHKIDAAFLKKSGVNLSTVNPQHLRLYGNGGGMLPQPNYAFRYDDLTENAVFVAGEADGKFDKDDYVLFYAQSSHAIRYDSANQQFFHETHLYSDTTFYFLTISSQPGFRVGNQPSLENTATEITTFDDYQFHESERTNLLHSGREWYGETFNVTTSQTFIFNIPGIVPASDVRVTSSVMAQAPGTTAFTVNLNDQAAGTQTIAGVGSGTYDEKGKNQTNTFVLNAAQTGNSPDLRVNLTYDKRGLNNAVGYLNYVGVQTRQLLQWSGNQTAFRSTESLSYGTATFVVSNATDQLQIWDVTDPLHPKNQLFTLNGSQARFGAETNTLREFVAFSGSTFDAPVSVSRVANQDIHGLATPELLIVSPSGFLKEANRLAQFRRQHDGLSVQVVATSQVYNEFSSGKQDITAIRDCIRHFYRKSPVLQYVLLFGDASFDYKNRVANNTNFVPVYESRQSLHPIYSHSSDDYFGFMDEDEGEWRETPDGNHTMEIGIGRLPVKSFSEAAGVVNKLMNYAQNPITSGEWRNAVCFVADDEDGNTHQLEADRLASQIQAKYPAYNLQKIYVDAYPQVSNPSGQTAPAVQQAINEAIEQGQLIINYTGHGGETGWTQEQILDIPQMNGWRNQHQLPLFVTATCEFGRYDDPVRTSGAEFILLNPKGGGIGLVTTTRPVFSNTNYALNQAFYAAVFEPQAGQLPRLGDVMRQTKNNSQNGTINRNFALLGDPSMRLAYPQEKAVITAINQQPPAADTLQALGLVAVEGYVEGTTDGQPLVGFNGMLSITVLDKAGQETTLGDKGTARMPFNQQQNVLFRGKAKVQAGKFRFSFVVPKDMDYRIGDGKISLYAYDSTARRDAAGWQNVPIGGSAANVTADNAPPQIRLFLNDTLFVDGGVTSPDPVLLAEIRDETGVNLSQTGIGHQLTATLSTNPEQVILLNNYYSADADTYQRGWVQYPFHNLPEGNYQLTLKAWDVHNNAAEAKLNFVVTQRGAPDLFNVFNFPNPFSGNTTFSFEHDRAGEDLEIRLEMYSITGQRVKTLAAYAAGSNNPVRELSWDGTGDAGNKLPPGVYIYRLSVRSMADNAQSHQTSRLLLIR